MNRLVTLAVTTTSTGYVLLRFLPGPTLLSELAQPRAWVLRVGTDAAAFELAGALLWLAAVWLAIGLLATGASLLPGRIGRSGRSVAVLTPPVIRRMVLAATGAAILVAPIASYADAPAAGSPTPSEVQTSAAANLPASAQPAVTEPALTWPTDSPATSRAAPDTNEFPTPSSTAPPTTAGTTTPPRPAPTFPAPTPARPPRTGQSKAAGTDDVTVGTGDSLWLITAHRLGAGASGARIAAEWPRWYAVNRTVIGADPDLIQPGTRLQPPAARTTATTTEE